MHYHEKKGTLLSEKSDFLIELKCFLSIQNRDDKPPKIIFWMSLILQLALDFFNIYFLLGPSLIPFSSRSFSKTVYESNNSVYSTGGDLCVTSVFVFEKNDEKTLENLLKDLLYFSNSSSRYSCLIFLIL